jgi:glycerol transport system ATP-binding protein
VALARALAKSAPLMLLDEPLVNLDYKLREELRDELSALFAAGNSTVVYATTEPGEALLLGGYTAVMDAGELLQYGATAEVFQRPRSIRVATAFSDPPMNLFPARVEDQALVLADASRVTLTSALAVGPVTAGLRASALRVQARDGDVAVKASVALAEISGSDTFVHLDTALGAMVAQLAGVHYFDLGEAMPVYFRPQDVYVFDSAGMLALAPTREGMH